ncbi:MAG: 1-acyl-sn-glycerol-3-phosphate acyltransferase [Bacteroidota bacterium]
MNYDDTTMNSDDIRNYDDIRPYNLQEVYDVFRKLSKLQTIRRLYEIFMPGVSISSLETQASMLTSIDEFQKIFILPGVNKIINDTTSGITFSGFDKLKPTQSYLFISNHRDIVLDSTFFETILHNLGFNTTETAIGNNLLKSKVIKEIAKINKTITVMRDGTVKELYKSALKLSAYIRETISSNRSSIWIAQRNGRTKDGNDLTQPGLLKMLFINCESVVDFEKLNIVPLSTKYEDEPWDHLKVLEKTEI